MIDKNGKIITSVPDINGNDVVYNFRMLNQPFVAGSSPNIAGRSSPAPSAKFFDTARYGKLSNTGAQLRCPSATRFSHSLRPTVSYQNLSADGDAFAKERQRSNLFSSNNRTGAIKCTTNVAWLVGAKSNGDYLLSIYCFVNMPALTPPLSLSLILLVF